MDEFWSAVASGMVAMLIDKLLDMLLEAKKKKVSNKHGKHIKKP